MCQIRCVSSVSRLETMNGQPPALQRVAKPKNRFTLCCFCLGGSGSDPDLSGATFDYNDKCDYVVEKLSIKKVPIALFATEEDLAEMRNAAIMEKCQEPVTTTVYEANLLTKDSILSSYYAMINNSEDTPNADKSLNRVKLAKDKFTNTLSQAKRDASVEMFVQRTSEGTNTGSAIEDVKDEKERGDHKPSPLPMPVPVLKPILKQNEIVKADVHRVIEEPNRRYSISPELQRTLTVLGSKQPETSQTIKQRMGFRTVTVPNKSASLDVEVKVKHVTIVEDEQSAQAGEVRSEAITCGMSAISFPTNSTDSNDVTKQESSMMSNESRAFVDNDGILVEQDMQTRLTCKQLEAMINGDVAGDYPNPKWKIIIKEHSKHTLASTTSSRSMTTTETDSEDESEYEESTTE